MSLIRIIDVSRNAYNGSGAVVVDVLHSDSEPKTYWFSLPSTAFYCEADLKGFVEREIKRLEHVEPDYKGLEWRSDKV